MLRGWVWYLESGLRDLRFGNTTTKDNIPPLYLSTSHWRSILQPLDAPSSASMPHFTLENLPQCMAAKISPTTSGWTRRHELSQCSRFSEARSIWRHDIGEEEEEERGQEAELRDKVASGATTESDTRTGKPDTHGALRFGRAYARAHL